MGVIYKITSPTGKVYIGQTKNLEKRIKQHRGGINYNQSAINNSFIKHGFESHIFEIVEYVDDDSLLPEKEKYYIKLFDSIKNGLNIHEGGLGGRTWQNSNKRDSVIIFLKSRVGDKNPNYGNKFSHTEDAKNKMRLNNNARKGHNHPKAKSLMCIETGEVFKTIKEIAFKYNVTPSGICCALKRYGTFRGMHFQLATL